MDDFNYYDLYIFSLISDDSSAQTLIMNDQSRPYAEIFFLLICVLKHDFFIKLLAKFYLKKYLYF